jgi:hypothetical protein
MNGYSKFGETDVFVYLGFNEKLWCHRCKLQPKEKTIFTTTGSLGNAVFGSIPTCSNCHGEGCEACMDHKHFTCDTIPEMVAHLKEHQAAGHRIGDSIVLLEAEQRKKIQEEAF